MKIEEDVQTSKVRKQSYRRRLLITCFATLGCSLIATSALLADIWSEKRHNELCRFAIQYLERKIRGEGCDADERKTFLFVDGSSGQVMKGHDACKEAMKQLKNTQASMNLLDTAVPEINGAWYQNLSASIQFYVTSLKAQMGKRKIMASGTLILAMPKGKFQVVGMLLGPTTQTEEASRRIDQIPK